MTEQEQTLLNYFTDLSSEDQHGLLRYAEFLATGKTSTSTESPVSSTAAVEEANDDIQKPIDIERPEQEKVVDALKRLSASYPMLEKQKLLSKASELVAQHVMFGKPAIVVINEIEAVFSEAYAKYVESKQHDSKG